MAKKIGAVVSLTIIGILIVATIIMANININYSVPCATPNDIYVQMGSNTAERVADANVKKEIINYISTASQENALTALFNGNMNNYAKVVSGKKGTISTNSSSFYVRYTYIKEQTLKEGDNKFVDEKGKSYTYEDLVFEISNIEGESQVKVYVISDDSNDRSYTHYYLVDADFGDLYSYLDNKF